MMSRKIKLILFTVMILLMRTGTFNVFLHKNFMYWSHSRHFADKEVFQKLLLEAVGLAKASFLAANAYLPGVTESKLVLLTVPQDNK